MGNTYQRPTKQQANAYPYNTLPLYLDGKIMCCFGIFPKRMVPYDIMNNVLQLDSVVLWGLAAICLWTTYEAWKFVFPGVFFLIWAIYATTLRCKWVTLFKKNTLEVSFCFYFWLRTIILWGNLLRCVALVAWLLNDLSQSYTKRESAPNLTHTDLDRMHESYVGTYWQEIASRSYGILLTYTNLFSDAYQLAVGCALRSAHYKLQVDKRELEKQGVKVEIDQNNVQVNVC